MNNASFWISVLSLLIALLAVLVGPIVSWLIAKRQAQITLSIAKRHTISPIRQEWIDKLRKRVAEIMSTSHQYFVAHQGDPSEQGKMIDDEPFRKRLFLYREIELMLNPDEDDHKQLLSQLDKISFAIGELKTINEFSKAMKEATRLAQKIFKDEWTRVKEEF